jgi:hypothetical protein
MRLILHELQANHPRLNGHLLDYAKCGALALQRANHGSPVLADVDHDGLAATAEIEWIVQDLASLAVIDAHRVTEDGAEAVALAYAHVKAGWVIERRMQRWERADWLLVNGSSSLALEISGTADGDPAARLMEKRRQVSLCLSAQERLAVVVVFDRPAILAASP